MIMTYHEPLSASLCSLPVSPQPCREGSGLGEEKKPARFLVNLIPCGQDILSWASFSTVVEQRNSE